MSQPVEVPSSLSLRAVVVNGEAQFLPDSRNLAAVLESLGLAGKPVAVEVDGEVVSRDRFLERMLNGGERIEVVTFVGGG